VLIKIQNNIIFLYFILSIKLLFWEFLLTKKSEYLNYIVLLRVITDRIILSSDKISTTNQESHDYMPVDNLHGNMLLLQDLMSQFSEFPSTSDL